MSATEQLSTYYVPGYKWAKILMLNIGLFLSGVGAVQTWSQLSLVVYGIKTQAEAVSVIKQKPGEAAISIQEKHQLGLLYEPSDRSYVFWNVFRFQTKGGEVFDIKIPVASRLKPLYPLADQDGLPTQITIYYDSTMPSRASSLQVISTWLLPALILFFGVGISIVGGTLLYWAKRPIELPQ
jgi:hypothetical protein